MEQAILALLTIVIGVGGCIGYFWLSNMVLDKVIFPARGPQAGRNITRANAADSLEWLTGPCPTVIEYQRI